MNSHSWGLDPLFTAHFQLVIKDIQSLDTIPGSSVYEYRGRPVCTVEICGVVVRLQIREQFSAYTVDDGTGVIECIEWNNSSGYEDTSINMDELGGELANKWRDLKEQNDITEYIQLGDLLTVQGKIRTFRGNRQITCQYTRVERDPVYEAFYMMRMTELYRNFYSRPIPEIKESSSRVKLEYQLRSRILTTSIQNNMQLLSVNELLKMEEIKELSQDEESAESFKEIINSVLKLLEQDGHLCMKPHSKDPTYLVVSVNEGLKSTILGMLRSECDKIKYQEIGCHYLHIYGELKKLVEYSHITKEAVSSCLQVLEGSSHIISTENGRYMYLDL